MTKHPLYRRPHQGHGERVSRRRRLAMALAVAIFGAMLGIGVAIGVLVHQVRQGLPDIAELDSYAPDVVTNVYDRHGEKVAEFFVQRRILIGIEEMPPILIQALQAVEDSRFQRHPGIDLIGIGRAALRNLQAGRVVEGASTITQQLARNLFLSADRTFMRKLREQWLSVQIEQRHTKEEILAMYANHIYLGNGAYGVEAAARAYFGKPALELAITEAALIAALPKGPAVYDPFRYPERALARRNIVLGRLADEGFLEAEDAAILAREPLGLRPEQRHRLAPHFMEQVRRELYARHERGLYREGLEVFTTLDPDAQRAAEEAVANGLDAVAERQDGAEPEGALVALELSTGAVLAMVGGRDFAESEFNRATQARRQVGSTIKPFVAAAALQRGRSPTTILPDEPVTFFPGKAWAWTPRNFTRRHYGPTSLREALAKSRNVPMASLASQVGIGGVIDLLQVAGVKSPLRPYLALSLGAGEATLLELTAAYGAFGSYGLAPQPYLIREVRDRQGLALYQTEPEHAAAMPPAVAEIALSLLLEVVSNGTATKAKALPYPVGGKTGTTSGNTDAWFVGLSASWAVGVWLGRDDSTSLGRGETGGRAALPVWIEFMSQARPEDEAFPSVRYAKEALVCAESGSLAGPQCTGRAEMFVPGTVPVEVCPLRH